MNDKYLEVYLNEDLVGHLSQVAGELEFRYVENAQRSLSLSMPIRTERYTRKYCYHYFDGLLPEDKNARRAIADKFGANPNNPFSMLKAIGQDCAGAVSFYKPGTKNDTNEKSLLKILTEEDLAEQIDNLESRPLFLGVEGVRISLAGFQEKAAVVLTEDNKIALPINRPSTHILKPAIKGYKESAMNEFLTMELARQLELDAPRVKLGNAQGREYVLVERYDRITKNGVTTRIHQEDFCQALGFGSHQKYQEEGGPTFKHCTELIRATAVPALDLFKLIDYIIFNYLVGNTDAHGKNFSLLYRQTRPVLAPLYDCLCLTLDSKLRRDMAMKIGDEYDVENVSEADWRSFCKKINYKYDALRERIKQLSYNMIAVVSRFKGKGAFEVEWRTEVEKRCKRCIAVLNL